jgi:WD40 repeat protein
VVLWEVATGKRLLEDPLPVKGGDVESVAFNPDGKTLAAGYRVVGVIGVGGVVLWEVATRKRLPDGLLPVKEGDVHSVAFSPDGTTLASGYDLDAGGGVVLWEVATRKRHMEGPLHVKEGDVRSVAFSPDGKTLAAGYGDIFRFRGGPVGGVVLWEVATGKRHLEDPFSVKEGYVRSVAFSPDGETLAAGYVNIGFRGGMVLWEVATRKRLLEDPLPVKVNSVAFSPDGTTLAAGYGVSGNGVVVQWDVALKSWECRAGQIANRNFTPAEWHEYFPDRPYGPTFCNLPVPPEQPAGRTATSSPFGSREPAKDDRR